MLTWVLIPQILVIAFRKRLFDVQDDRKIHEGIVPRLGGIAFVPAIICSVAFVLGLDSILSTPFLSTLLQNNFVGLMFLFCSLLLLFLVGIADDLIELRYRAKFIFQGIAAILTIASGIYVSDLHGILWLGVLPEWAGWAITALAIVYCINAINLIDGIDGLAAGLVLIALTFYGIILFIANEYLYSMLAWAGVGSLIPFLYFNLFGHVEKHRKIFMGDTGSLTLGMLVVFETLVVCNLPANAERLSGANPLIIAFAPLIVPLFDLARVFLHRLKRRRNPFLPDRCHIHHKLLDLGLSSRASLAIILLLSVTYTMANLWLSMAMDVNLLLLIDIAVWIVGQMLLTAAIRRRENKNSVELYN